MASTGLFVFSVLLVCQALGQIIEPTDPDFRGLRCRTANSTEPHPDPCRDDRFVQCFQGVPSAVMRCGLTLVYNSNRGECTRKPQGYIKAAGCRDPQTCEEVKYDGSYIAGRDCSYFIVCVPGEPVIRCAPGSYFKYEIQNCAWPGFGQITNAEIEACGRTGYTVRTTAPTVTRSPTNPCQGMLSGNVEYPNNCARYYSCSSGYIVNLLDCPVDYRFDTRYGQCQPMNYVNCGARPSD